MRYPITNKELAVWQTALNSTLELELAACGFEGSFDEYSLVNGRLRKTRDHLKDPMTPAARRQLARMHGLLDLLRFSSVCRV